MREFAPEDVDFYLDDPYPALARLRREDPVHWYEKASCWCLTKHADVEHVSRSPELFTSTRGVMLGVAPESRPPGVPPAILEMDPPDHNRHRKLVMQAFTPRAVAALEPQVRALARESLDAVPVGEPVDFVAAVAVPLPTFVIAEMMGVPRADWSDFGRWSDATIRAASGLRDAGTDAALREMFGYFAQHLADRRRTPREDLVSKLARAEIDDEFAGLIVEDHGAGRHADEQVVAREAVLLLEAAGVAALGLPLGPALKVEQRVDVLIGDKDDIAAIPPIAAIWPALGHVLLAAERHAAVSAVSGLDRDGGAIDEHAGG